mgnify:CR=1 FL=1
MHELRHSDLEMAALLFDRELRVFMLDTDS